MSPIPPATALIAVFARTTIHHLRRRHHVMPRMSQRLVQHWTPNLLLSGCTSCWCKNDPTTYRESGGDGRSQPDVRVRVPSTKLARRSQLVILVTKARHTAAEALDQRRLMISLGRLP